MVNKKGFIDNIYLVITTIVAFFAILVMSYAYGEIKTGLNNQDIIANNTDAQEIFVDVEKGNTSMDWLMILLFFGTVGSILLTLYFLRSNPLFFIIGLILLVVVVFLAILLTDVFSDIIALSPEISGEVSSYPKSNFLFENLPIIALVILAVFLIFAYMNKGGLSE
jgi:magnesium-transporting ATPase (P-type)